MSRMPATSLFHPATRVRGRVARLAALLAVVLAAVLSAAPVLAVPPGNEHFQRTWARTDQPVAAGLVNRTWMWGPEAITEAFEENYADAPGGKRLVQYFDKSRMEINNPAGDPTDTFFVTNGLLVVEIINGRMQVGHDQFEPRPGARQLNVAGDADDPTGPTYETIGGNIEAGYAFQEDQLITGVIDRNGVNPSQADEMYDLLAGYGVTAGPYSPETQKHTASVFWEFMTSDALVYENGSYVIAPLFENPYYATGLPIDQAWWANVKVAGTYKWVLIQCFERRCLTYTPDNPDGWKVEAGNVGQHYLAWRYDEGVPVPPQDPPPGTPPVADPPDDDPPIDDPLSGTWINDDGDELRLQRDEGSSSLTALFIEGEDAACPYGGVRPYYIQGTLSGNTLTGTMSRCTRLEEMVVDCGLSSVWETTVTATVSENTISGTYRSEWYDYDDEASGDCKWVRNPSGDEDVPFSITRTGP